MPNAILLLCCNFGLPLILLQALAAGEHNSVQQPTPIVGLELSASGFHRDLHYSVQFDYPLAGKEECEYVLEQPLPAATYVSVDQLDDLKRLRKLNSIYPKFVDVEMPTEKSEAFTVLLMGTPKITDRLKLPIHFRYHAPRTDDSKFALVELSPPKMYMNCRHSDNDLIDNEMQPTPSTLYCLHEDISSFVKSSTVNTESATLSSTECDWKLINVDFKFKSPLIAKIPIGNEKSYPPILYATIIVSWIISLWTICRTKAMPLRINQKLEEQRILQNKNK